MAKLFPESINSRAHRAFDKVRADIETLKHENRVLKEQIQHYDPFAVAEVKRELTLLRDKQDAEIEKLKNQIAKCTCAENKADINQIRRDISKISFSSVKEDVSSLKQHVKSHSKSLKSLQNSVDKVLLSDSVSKRVEELENDLEERLDTIERRLELKNQGTSKQQVNEDEVIDKFASSYDKEEDNKNRKSFKKWLFSKESDTDDVDEVK